MKNCREKKEEDCWIEWRIVGKSGGMLEQVEDCRRQWRIVSKRGGLYFGGAGRRGTSSNII